MERIVGVPVGSWHHNSRFIVEQGKGVAAKGDYRQFAAVNTHQTTDEVGVGKSFTDAEVVFIKNGGADDNAMLNGIGQIEQVLRTDLDGIDVRMGI